MDQVDWSGAYAGLFAGGIAGTVDAPVPLNDADLGGVTAGAFGGYNVNLNGIVFGAEADVGKSLGDVNAPGEDGTYSFAIDWTAHLRGRVGLAVEHALFYLAGGVAVASGSVDTPFDDDNQVHAGWTLGGGVEFALNEAMTLRAEYLHDDYGTANYGIGEGTDIDLTADTARVGFSVKF